MNDYPIIVCIGRNSVIKNRISSLLSDQEIKFLGVKDQQGLQRVLAARDYQISLLISDLEVDNSNDFNAISLIRYIKAKGKRIPIIVLSSESKADVVSQCLRAGATEYILKPFQDEYLKDKILKYIDVECLNKSTMLNFNLNDFLSGEIYKARKGKYSFTLLSIKFNTNYNDEADNVGFLNCADMIYNSIKELFWESDLYIQHGFQSHLGFFPFCTNNDVKLITKKIQTCLGRLKLTEPALTNFSYTLSYASFPADGEVVSDLLNKLQEV